MLTESNNLFFQLERAFLSTGKVQLQNIAKFASPYNAESCKQTFNLNPVIYRNVW
jgi:hypothetical protein